MDLAAAAAFAGLTAALIWWPPILRMDIAVRDWVDAHRPPPVEIVMLAFDHIGQRVPVMIVTLVIAFTLAWRARTVRPILPAALAPILTTACVTPLKRWSERGAPHYGSVHLFSRAGATSYPSGHVNNGMVYYAVLALLLGPFMAVPARRVLRWLPGALVFIGTTYVAYHWLTDSIGGFLLGLVLARLMLRVPWERVWLPGSLDRGNPPRGDPAQ